MFLEQQEEENEEGGLKRGQKTPEPRHLAFYFIRERLGRDAKGIVGKSKERKDLNQKED